MAGMADLREAITAASGALPLIPKDISPLLLEYVRKFAPTRVAFPRQTWNTDIYYFNQRNALPRAQFVQEVPPLTGAGSVTATSSNYLQTAFAIKHFQSNGDVSKFAQKVARINGSLLDLEIRGSTMAMGWLEEIAHIYGNAAATVNTLRPQWDGLDRQIGATNKIDAQSIVSGTGLFNFAMLDALIDAVRVPYAANLSGDNYFFMMSPKMQSRLVQQTLANTRLMLEKRPIQPKTDGGVFGDPVVTDVTDPGVEVYYYRGVPIIETSFLSAQGQMGAVALSQAAGTTPFLLNAVRKYVVSAVTIYGETLACAEQSITISTAGNSVTLTWATPTILDPFGNALPIILYRIFESATSGAETLLAVVPAFDNNDNPVTSFTDLGAASAANALYWQSGANGDGATYPLTSVAGNANGYGVENIYLCSRDPETCVVPVVNDLTAEILAPVNARSVQFAVTGDQCLAIRAPLFAAKLERCRFA